MSARDSQLLAFLGALIVCTCLVYYPGLSGGFLFDDFINLEPMGALGGVVDTETLRNFVFTGFSGPTGRPLALLSFLLNDITWPSSAASFKRTNLLIHLLTGLLICWSSLRLLRLMGREETPAAWIALLASGIWLLHPYFASTTLYVIQRMAQLSALFMVAGMLGYLHGRALLASRPRAGYLWMSISLVVATVLAAFSKENGVLLPLLLLVTEFSLGHRFQAPRLDRRWAAIFLWIPSAALVGYLVSTIDFRPDLWPARSFDMAERLLTEARIIWEYLLHLWVPRIEGRGLFQDGFLISTGLLSPPSTLISLLGVAALSAGAIWARRRAPLFSFAILFFFAGHLIESTVIGLELYFEHRNYLPASFLFLPLAAGLVWLGENFRRSVTVVIGLALFAMLGVLTYQRAALWGDTDRLQLYWAANTPESPRANNAIAEAILKSGNISASIDFLDQAVERLPNSALLSVRLLAQRIAAGQATQQDFARTARRARSQPFDAQSLMAMRLLTNIVTTKSPLPENITGTQSVLDGLEGNRLFKRMPVFVRLVPYLRGQLFLAQNKPQEAFLQYSLAIERYRETDASLAIVTEMARSRHFDKALDLLKQAEVVFAQQDTSTLRRPRSTYQSEFERLRENLLNDISASKQGKARAN